MIFDALVLATWLSPFFYLCMTITGKIYRYKKARNKRIIQPELIIFQIPTIGNVDLVNQTFRIVKSYNLPVKLRTWVLIEEDDPYRDSYQADEVVVIPSVFECEDLYKSRALEYARIRRVQMLRDTSIPENYLLLQADDDATPTKDFILDCLKVNADIVVGSMRPIPVGFWSTILDYERSIACGMFCNLFTNIDKPVWAHGEGLCISSGVDQKVNYEISEMSKSFPKGFKLVCSEDLFYLHKAAYKGFTLYNSEKSIYIAPPLFFKDGVKQRRRWIWGHINILRYKLIPRNSRIRLALAEFTGLAIYFIATFGTMLHSATLIVIPKQFQSATWTSLLVWLGLRGYIIGKSMGWKHGVFGALASYVTVTLNFLVHLIGFLKGDPKRFEVIEKRL